MARSGQKHRISAAGPCVPGGRECYRLRTPGLRLPGWASRLPRSLLLFCRARKSVELSTPVDTHVDRQQGTWEVAL